MDETASGIVNTTIRIKLRNLKKFFSLQENTFSVISAVLDNLARYLKKSVLGLHLYYPAPWGGVDQWPLKM